jgi:ribose transport system permease protein
MVGIASAGLIFVIIIGGIDLSIGSMVTVVNILVAWLMVRAGVNPVTAGLIGILASILIGFFNGCVVANIGIPPLIATLATQIALSGAAYLLCNGLPIFGFKKSFAILGQGYLWVIPIPVIVMIVCLLVSSFILNKTFFGRHFYALGSNAEAAKFSGIRIKRMTYLAYSMCGFFAGLSGVVLLSRTNSGQPGAGLGFEFDVITALVLGGVSITGGAGTISSAVAGVLIIGVLSNGFVIAGVNTYVQQIIKGAILLVAVGFDCIQKKRQSRVAKKT